MVIIGTARVVRGSRVWSTVPDATDGVVRIISWCLSLGALDGVPVVRTGTVGGVVKPIARIEGLAKGPRVVRMVGLRAMGRVILPTCRCRTVERGRGQVRAV